MGWLIIVAIRDYLIYRTTLEGEHIGLGRIKYEGSHDMGENNWRGYNKRKKKSKDPMFWGKSIERDHIIKGKSKYCGGVKIRDKKEVGWVENGRKRVSSR